MEEDFNQALTVVNDSLDDLPAISGNQRVTKAKMEIVEWLWAHLNFEEAVEKVGVPLHQANSWRNESSKNFDIRFAMWCDIWEAEEEQRHLAQITKNVMEKAKDDAKIGLQVLKARQPEKWNPGKVETASSSQEDNRRKFIPTRGAIKATYKEIH